MNIRNLVIILDPSLHYQLRKNPGGSSSLYKYPEACPQMGDREKFKEDEGTLVANIKEGQGVTFAYHIVDMNWDPNSMDDTIHCGDDIRYNLLGKDDYEIEPNTHTEPGSEPGRGY